MSCQYDIIKRFSQLAFHFLATSEFGRLPHAVNDVIDQLCLARLPLFRQQNSTEGMNE
jgi:hypothetical protein